MLQVRPPPGDACRDKGVALSVADARGIYDQIRFALTRAALDAEGRPERTVNVLLRRDGAEWVLGGPRGRIRYFCPKPASPRAVEPVYSAAFSVRADAVMTKWNALMAALHAAIDAQLRADGFEGVWYLHARGGGAPGLWLLDLLGLSRTEARLVEDTLAPRRLASRAFLDRDDEDEWDE
jgi:hypothetical protein